MGYYTKKVYDRHPFQEVREEKLTFIGLETKNFNPSAIIYNIYWFFERITISVIILKMKNQPMIQLSVIGGCGFLHLLLVLNTRPWGLVAPTAFAISN